MAQLLFADKRPKNGPRNTLLNKEKLLLVRSYKMAVCYPVIIHTGPGIWAWWNWDVGSIRPTEAFIEVSGTSVCCGRKA